MKKRILITTLMCVAGVFAQENYSTWSHFRDVSINTTAQDGATTASIVTKFPLLVRLTAADADVFAAAAAKGADIRFSKANHVTRLPYQRERYDAVNKLAEFWVLVDSVFPNADNRIRMYWGKAGAVDSSNGPEVFDTANGFVGAWHLGDSTANNPRPDAVVGAPQAVLQNFNTTYYPSGYTGGVPGAIGLADTLTGGSESGFQGSVPYIDVGRTNYAGFSDFTGFSYSVWVWDNGPVAYGRYLEAWDDSAGSTANRIILFGNYASDANDLAARWGGTSFNGANADIVPGQWQHIFFTKAPNGGTLTAYINGTATDSMTGVADLPVVLRTFVYMGRSTVTASDPYFNGKFDEMVMAKQARSADWIKLSYGTQVPGQTSVVLGKTDTALPAGIHNAITSTAGFSIISSSSGYLFRLPGNLSGAHISVMDIWGRVVWSQTASNGTTELSWNTKTGKSAAPGIYLVRLTAGNGLSSKVLADSKITLVP